MILIHLKVMQQLTQFEQKAEVAQISALLEQLTYFDRSLLDFFIREHVPDPKHLFLTIIRQPVPRRKAQQEQILTLLTYTYYRLEQMPLLPNQLQMLKECYQEYVAASPFMPQFVRCHQMVRQWSHTLSQTHDLVSAKKNLDSLLIQIENAKDVRLDILVNRLKLCEIVLDVTLKKVTLQRSKVVKFMKGFQQLKKERKVAIQASVHAFSYIISQLIIGKIDLYLFFQMEIKQMKKQFLPQEQYSLIEHTLQKCQDFQTTKIVSAVHTYVRKNIPKHQNKIRRQNKYPVVYNNQEVNDNILRKVDHFIKYRTPIALRARSHQTRSSRPSIEASPRVAQHTKTQMSLHETTRLGWFRSAQKKWKEQSGISLNKTGVFTKRKRRQIYKNIIKDKEKEGVTLGRVNLLDQMAEIEARVQERCRLSLEDILFGEISNNKTNEDLESAKIVGAPEDRQFGEVTLTFFTIFNQEMAQLVLNIAKKGKQYLFDCKVTSTYCRNYAKFTTNSQKTTPITIQAFENYLENSVIYYEAIQERVQRKISIKELQIFDQMLRVNLSIELSQYQLQKILFAVDLAKSQFFWYYTKSSLINGSRIEKRINIDLQDQSAFAVCLSKFKSDYDSCLNELIEVQNMTSLIENCHYLSHGRMVVYRQFRKVEGRLLLQVISISEEVYKSVKKRGKIPYFESTWLERSFLDPQKGKVKKIGASQIDARAFLTQKEIFVVFMKNIVENFIEIKYVHKFRQYLKKHYESQNQPFFKETSIHYDQDYHLECLNNSQIYQNIQNKPIMPPQIINFRQSLLNYVTAYKLKPIFHIDFKHRHIIKVGNQSFFVEQIGIRNGIRIIKYYKSKIRMTFSLFFYHQKPLPLIYISTPFHNRLAFTNSNKSQTNLIRNSLPQQHLVKDSSCHFKMIIRLKNTYCYASISQSQSLLTWRLDLYIPQTQTHLSTFFDQDLAYECISIYETTGKAMWHRALSEAIIDINSMSITIFRKKFQLFQALKQITVHEGKNSQYLCKIELIDIDNQLYYMITHYESGKLSLGRYDDIPFIYVSQLISPGPNKLKPKIYCNLITRLSHQLRGNLAPSETISPQFFIRE